LKKKFHIIIIAFLFSSVLWVSITLTEEYYTTYQVPLRVVNTPYGYTLASELPSEISVKIKGIGWRLTGIGIGSESFFNVSARNDSGRIVANLFANLVENPWLSSDVSVIDISPDTVSFIVERITSKKLKVVPDVDLTFRTGFGLASEVKVVPDSVVVFGPKSLIANLNYISTRRANLKALDNITKIKLPFNNDMFSTNNAVVEVTLDVQRIVDKEFENIRVEVLDMPDDRDVVLLPNTITCLVVGGINVLGRLSSLDFSAYVHYRDVMLDTLGTVAPELKAPENIEVISQKPDRLRYIIRKFN
jgi:YbbR domain-containing protein